MHSVLTHTLRTPQGAASGERVWEAQDNSIHKIMTYPVDIFLKPGVQKIHSALFLWATYLNRINYAKKFYFFTEAHPKQPKDSQCPNNPGIAPNILALGVEDGQAADWGQPVPVRPSSAQGSWYVPRRLLVNRVPLLASTLKCTPTRTWRPSSPKNSYSTVCLTFLRASGHMRNSTTRLAGTVFCR